MNNRKDCWSLPNVCWKPSPLCQLCGDRLGQTKISAANHFLTRHKVGYSVSSILARDLFVGQTSSQEVWQVMVELETKQEIIDKKQFAIKCKDGVITANQLSLKKLDKELKRKIGDDKETMTDDPFQNVTKSSTEETRVNVISKKDVKDCESMKKQLASKIEMKTQVSSLFRTLDGKNKQLKISEDKCKELDKEVKTLQEALKHKRSFIEKTMNNFCKPALSNENISLKKEVKELTKKNSRLRKLGYEKELKIEALQKELKNTKMAEEMGGLISVVRKQSKKIEKQAGLIEVALRESQDLNSKIERQKHLVDYFKKELIGERCETEEKAKEIQNLNKIIHGLKFQLKDLEISLDGKESAIRDFENCVQKITAEKEMLCESLRESFGDRKQDESSCNAALKEKESYEESLNKIEKQLVPIQKEYEAFKKEKQVLVKLLETSNQEITDCNVLIKQLQHEKRAISGVNLSLQEEVKDLLKFRSEQGVENERLKKLKLQLLTELKEVKKEVSKERAQNGELSAENMKSLLNLKQYENYLEGKRILEVSLKDEITKLENNLQTWEEKGSGLEETIKKLEDNEKLLKEKQKNQEDLIRVQNQSLHDVNDDLQIISDQKLALNNQLDEVRNQLRETITENEKLSSEEAKLQENVHVNDAKILTLEDQINELNITGRSTFNEDITKLQEVVKNLECESRKASRINLEFKVKCKNLEELRTMLQNDLDVTQLKLKASEDSQAQLVLFRTQLAGLKWEWKEQADENHDMVEMLINKNKKLEEEKLYVEENMKQKIVSLESKNVSLKVNYDKLKLSTESLKGKIRELYEVSKVPANESEPEIELVTEISQLQDEVLKEMGDLVKDLENNNEADPSRILNQIKIKEYKVWKLKKRFEKMQDVGDADQTLVMDRQMQSGLNLASTGSAILNQPGGASGNNEDRSGKRKQDGRLCFSLNKKSKR